MTFAPILGIALVLITVYVVLAIHRLAMNDPALTKQAEGIQRLRSADWYGIRITGFAIAFGLIALAVFGYKLWVRL